MGRNQSYDISLEVPLPRPLGFTPLDILQGTLHLTLRASFNLNCIEVSLKGVSTAKLNLRRLQSNGTEKPIQKEETHQLLDIARIIFPDVNSPVPRYAALGKEEGPNAEYVLGPGSYRFDFELEIPLNGQCFDQGSRPSQGKRKTSSSSLLSQLSISSSSNDIMTHKLQPLPPSLNSPEDYYFTQYSLTATIHRKSRLKQNISLTRIIKIVPFTPLKYHTDEYSNQLFIRKQTLFKSKIPEIIAVLDNLPPLYQNLVPSSPSLSFIKRGRSNEVAVYATDVPFALEARFKGGLLTIGQGLDFKLYVVSTTRPETYLGINGKSSKLGLIILKRLSIVLRSITEVKCNEAVNNETKRTTLCSIQAHGSIDLAYAVKSKPHTSTHSSSKQVYEIALPRSLYEDYGIPPNTAPSFETCNLKRKYVMEIRAEFFDEIGSDAQGKGKLVDVILECPIVLISGVDIPRGEAVEILRGEVREVGNGVRNLGLPSYGEAVMADGSRR